MEALAKTDSLARRYTFKAKKVHFKAIILTFPAENFKRIRYFAWSDPILLTHFELFLTLNIEP